MNLLEELQISPEDLVALDREFGAFLRRQASDISEDHQTLLAELGMALSCHIRSGHTHLPLPENPELAALFKELKGKNIVSDSSTRNAAIPLLLTQSHRLYLRKYYNYETEIAERFSQLSRQKLHLPAKLLAPGQNFKLLFKNFTPAYSQDGVNYQTLAVFNALCRDLAVISGGPGTGKTTVAAAYLALELNENPTLRIQLAAPTGKAQARLRESLAEDGGKLNVSPELKQQIQAIPAQTIHALLKPNPITGEYRYNRENPLPIDLLVIDESSMVSLTLMAHLLRALPLSCRLVLLGDRFQLSSVEAGALLGDLCDSATINQFEPEVAAAYELLTGEKPQTSTDSHALVGTVTELMVNHRFAQAPHIGQIAQIIRAPETLGYEQSTAQICGTQEDDFKFFEHQQLADLKNHLEPWKKMKKLVNSPEKYAQAFREQNKLQIITVSNNGKFGRTTFNQLIGKALNLPQCTEPGTPVIVLVNHARTGLHNGDVGLIVKEKITTPAGEKTESRVAFPQFEHTFAPSNLPPYEPVWAMTAHKSQGSGYDTVILVLPEQPTPILTRELLYTAVTRARKQVLIYGSRDMVQYALEHPTRRDSGLRDRWKR